MLINIPDHLAERLIEAVRHDMRHQFELMHHTEDKLTHGYRIHLNKQILEAINPKQCQYRITSHTLRK